MMMNRLYWIDNSEKRPVLKGKYLVRLVSGERMDLNWDGRCFRSAKLVFDNREVSHWLIEVEAQQQ